MHPLAFSINKQYFFDTYGVPFIPELKRLFYASAESFTFYDFVFEHLKYYMRIYKISFDELIKNINNYKEIDFGLHVILITLGYLKKKNDFVDLLNTREQAQFITDKNTFLLASVLSSMLNIYSN